MQSKLGYLLSGPMQLSELQCTPIYLYITQTLDIELSNCPESLPNSCLSTPKYPLPGIDASQQSQPFTYLYQQNCISGDSDGLHVPLEEKPSFSSIQLLNL